MSDVNIDAQVLGGELPAGSGDAIPVFPSETPTPGEGASSKRGAFWYNLLHQNNLVMKTRPQAT